MPTLNQDGTLRWVQKETEALEYAASVLRMVGPMDAKVAQAADVCQDVADGKLTVKGLQKKTPELFGKEAKDGAKAG